MTRWAISPIIGSGVVGFVDGVWVEDPYRAKVTDYGDHEAIIPVDDQGALTSTWCLTRIGDNALTAAEDDVEVQVFPDLGPEEVITPDLIPIGRGTVDQPNLNEWVFLTMTEAVEGVGQLLDPAFRMDWIP